MARRASARLFFRCRAAYRNAAEASGTERQRPPPVITDVNYVRTRTQVRIGGIARVRDGAERHRRRHPRHRRHRRRRRRRLGRLRRTRARARASAHA